jgi:RNase H-fold protein (predicted Holliday junction resolvase)
MNQINSNHFRILAIAPSTKGIGYVVLEGQDYLVDWAVKTVKPDNKNVRSLKKVEELVVRYQPGALVLENVSAKGSRRSPRIRKLYEHIIKMAKGRQVSVKLYSREQVMRTFIADEKGTKHALAVIIANRFPEQLGSQLPAKRRAWDTEDFRMAIFDAGALALMFRMKKIR